MPEHLTDSLALQDDVVTSINQFDVVDYLYLGEEVITSITENGMFDSLELSEDYTVNIYCISVEDFFYVDDDAEPHGDLRFEAIESLRIREVLGNNQKTTHVYDVVIITETLLNGGTLNADISDDLELEEEILLGKELTIALEDTLHIEIHGYRAKEASTNDTVTASDTTVIGSFEIGEDDLLVEDESVGLLVKDRSDSLTLADSAGLKKVLTRPRSETLTIADSAAGYMEDLTKEYQPL